MKIAIVDYGAGNIRSVERGLAHVGAPGQITSDPGDIEAADAIVLPGVGAFEACMRQVAPLQNLPQKVVLASHQIDDFYKKRFPAQNSEIPSEFGKLAVANGVTIEQAKYKEKEEGPGKLRPVEIEADLAGNYTSLAKFINALERDQTFFIINNVTLGGEPQGPVKLNVKLEAFLKAAS